MEGFTVDFQNQIHTAVIVWVQEEFNNKTQANYLRCYTGFTSGSLSEAATTNHRKENISV